MGANLILFNTNQKINLAVSIYLCYFVSMKRTKEELREDARKSWEYSRSLWDEIKQLRKMVYEPLTKDAILRKEAVDFAKFLFTMNVVCVDYGKQLYKTNTGMAPDILTETLEQMFDRHIQSKL
jgi:hypothetical protein